MVRFAALLALWPGGAEACRLALILAMDVSSSGDAAEDQLQRQGLAAALVAQTVQDAFFASPDPVALAVFEWSGRYNQQDLLDWRLIKTSLDLALVASDLRASRRSHNDFPTAMGHALGHAAVRLQEAPACLFQTIDIAGDGINNDGFGPAEAYAAFPFGGVTVNGLVVNAAEYEAEVDLIQFYKAEVLRGSGSFLEIANGFSDYASAMERKLIRELSAMVIGGTVDAGQGG